ncbi:hypothetical protein GCM10027048_01680 [Hymenobacter coalescens]
MNAQDIIQALQLLAHPEGGYYRETYRSPQRLSTAQGTSRNVSTGIYYLLENEDKSHFHRIQSDELWFFHQGQPLEIVLLQDGQAVSVVLGNDLLRGEVPQAVIPAGTWFGARLLGGVGYALVSCTVAPGFDFADFELATRAELTRQFPAQRELIETFTPAAG